MASLANLGVALAGLTTMGGIVYGSYELLKDVPRPVTELLEIKKRTPLDKNGDQDAWNQSWQSYLSAHTKTIEVEPTSSETTTNPPPQKQTKQVIDTNDIWGLLRDWESQSNKTDVPTKFKDRCEQESSGQQAGIWTKSYKDFEKYCTKDLPVED